MTATRRRPGPRPVRRTAAAAAAAAAPAGYRKTRAIVALALLIWFFSGIWILNGELTSQFVQQLTGRGPEYGWAAHLLITAIEIAPAILAPFLADAPARLKFILWLISLPFGVFDVLSSAVGVAPYLAFTHTSGIYQYTQNTIAAEIIGFVPEPMILLLLVALWRVVKAK